MNLAKLRRHLLPGVSWKNPVLASLFEALNPLDNWLRARKGVDFAELPTYAHRIRSNGARRQLGGKRFINEGNRMTSALEKFGGLKRCSEILEIGCGCGRNAFALARNGYAGSRYVGMDIEQVSLEACQRNEALLRKGFRFELMDIQNDEYNPNGEVPAEEFVFPFNDSSFDLIFLVSVFTHMKTSDVANYIAEMSRMTKPGGISLFTAFLMDEGTSFKTMSFPFKEDQHYFFNKELPEIALGYEYEFLKAEFAKHGLNPSTPPQMGSWRGLSDVSVKHLFAQDLLAFRRPTSAA